MTGQVHTRAELSAVQHRRRRSVALGLVLVMAVALCTATQWKPASLGRLLIEDVGLVLIAVAVIGRAWCSLYIGGRKAAELVTTGPYSISRNPLYLFSFVGASGVGAQSGSLTLSAILVLAAMAIFLPLIAREEMFLAHTMPQFDTYRRSTPKLWPRPSLWCSPHQITIQPALFLRTLFDGLPFVLAWPVFDVIEAFQRSGLLPVIARFP